MSRRLSTPPGAMTATGTAPSVQRDNPAPGYMKSLDGLRGLAAVIVVFSHLSSQTGILQFWFEDRGGQIGVMLFFCLSGFLMAHVYFGQQFHVGTLGSYAVNRCARVVPLFLLVVVGSYVCRLLWENAPVYPITSDNVIAHLTLRVATSVLWTIPVELKFYALFPFIWIVHRISYAAGTACAAALLVTYFSIENGAMPIMRLGHYFLLGILCHAISSSLPRARWQNMAWIAAAVALLLVFPFPLSLIRETQMKIWWDPWIAAAIAGFMVSSTKSEVAMRVLGSAPARGAGQISYSLYLLHMPVIWSVSRFLSPTEQPVTFWVIALSFTFLTSFACFHLFERPAGRFIRRVGSTAATSTSALAALSRSRGL